MEDLLAPSAYAILNGSIVNIGISSFFFTWYAKRPIEKAGFLLCSLALVGLFVHTLAHLRLSLYIAFCWFMGFAIAAMAGARQHTQSDSPQTLRIERMRKASRSSRVVSGLTLSLLVLVLPTGFAVPVTRAAVFLFSLLLLLIVASAISLLADYLARPSRVACFVCALVALLLVIASTIPFLNIIAGRPGLGTTLSLALCAAGAILLYYHAAAISKLTPHELVLANSPGRRSILSLRHSAIRPGVPRLRAVIAWAIDILARLFSGLSGFFKLFLVGSIAYIVFFVPWLFVRMGLSWDAASDALGTLGLEELVLIAKQLAFIAGIHGALIAFAVLFSGLAFSLQKSSRYLSRAKYQATVNDDDRTPILFLRAFGNDQATLPKPPLWRRLWEGRLASPALDHQLIDEFSLLAPVVALGLPDEAKLPFGASRLYVDPSLDWMADVIRIAKESLAIVVVCTETDSVAQEIAELQAAGLMHKVLFLANPETPEKGLEKHGQVKPMLQSPSDSIVAGFYKVGDAASRTLICKKLDAEDYIVCCNAFFTELTEPGSVPHAFDRLVVPV